MTASEKPLAGMRLVVTRARHQADSLVERLSSLGATVISLPMIEIGPPESWEELDRAIDSLSGYDWVVLASVNAVHYFCGRLDKVWTETKPRFATIGPSTSAALKKFGMPVSYQAGEFVAESFVRGFPQYPNLAGIKVLWPKTNIGRMLIVDELRKAGADVDVVHCYRTTLPGDAGNSAETLLQMLKQREVDVIMLASAQTARNTRVALDMVAPWGDVSDLFHPVSILAIGPETARAARESLGKCDLQAAQYTTEGMVQALLAIARPS